MKNLITRKNFYIRNMELKDIDNEFVNNLNNKKNNKFLDIKKRKQSKKTAIDYFKKINSDGDYYLGIFAKNKPNI